MDFISLDQNVGTSNSEPLPIIDENMPEPTNDQVIRYAHRIAQTISEEDASEFYFSQVRLIGQYDF